MMKWKAMKPKKMTTTGTWSVLIALNDFASNWN